VNRSLKHFLQATSYAFERLAEGRGSDLLSDFGARGRKLVNRSCSHTWQTIGSFAAGVGLGIGVGMLVAPATGKETRDAMTKKVQEISNKVGEHLPADEGPRPTGTEVS
jgi:hypothetical protein